MKILLAAAAIAISAFTAHAQLFVTHFFGQTVSTYDPATGATINANLITGLTNTEAITAFGGALYVANGNPADSIGKYALDGTPIAVPLINFFQKKVSVSDTDLFVFTYANTLGKYTPAGAVVNASFITVLNDPRDIVRSGNTLYIANAGTNSVGTYRADTGAVINDSLITGLAEPTSLALFNNTLYVSNYTTDTVGSYNATSGTAINASLITGLGDPVDITVFGGFLYVANRNIGTIGKYTPGGAVINAAFISGVFAPNGLAVAFDKSKAIDLGVISDTTTDYATPDRTVSVTIAAARDVSWYKFTIPENADLASTRFLDIATRPNNPSTLSSNDTEIGIYDANGVLVATDDDSGIGFGSSGNYSQLSFNPNVAARGPLTASGFPNAAPASGQNGTLAAGTYYLAVAPFNTIFGADFDVAYTSTNTGTFNLEFRTDIPLPNRAPTVAVTAKSIKPTTKSKIKIAGTTTDADGDALKVFVKVGKAGFRPAKVAGSKWSFIAKLHFGKNFGRVYSKDGAGLRSATKKFKIIRRR